MNAAALYPAVEDALKDCADTIARAAARGGVPNGETTAFITLMLLSHASGSYIAMSDKLGEPATPQGFAALALSVAVQALPLPTPQRKVH